MAEEFEMFEIDESFDPLEDLEDLDDLDGAEDSAPDSDYQLPGAGEGSHVAGAEPALPPRERIAQLIERMPGQKGRLLATVAFCEEPRTLDEIAEHLKTAFPADVSVYGPDRLVALLERAGAIEGADGEAAEDGDGASAPDAAPCDGSAAGVGCADAQGADAEHPSDGASYLTVNPSAPRTYTATEDGAAFAGRDARVQEILDLAAEDGGRYVPLYRKILELTSQEGGCPVKAVNAAIDANPLCEEPRRFATYFLHRLEQAGGVAWNGTWHATEFGAAALETDEFAQRA